MKYSYYILLCINNNNNVFMHKVVPSKMNVILQFKITDEFGISNWKIY